MNDGIPIVYYGLEQGFSGGADPANREALWPSNYTNTTTVQYITKLNKLRKWLIGSRPAMSSSSSQVDRSIDENAMFQSDEKLYRRQQSDDGPSYEKVFNNDSDNVIRRDEGDDSDFINSPAIVAGATQQAMAIVRGSVIGVVTNIGSPVSIFYYIILHLLMLIYSKASKYELSRAYSV